MQVKKQWLETDMGRTNFKLGKEYVMAVYSHSAYLTYMHSSEFRVQSLSRVWLFETPWSTARPASLSITNSQGPPKSMSIVSVIPSYHLILCHPLLLSPSILPSIRVFSNELVLPIRWPKYWSFSFSISPSNEYSGLISFRIDWLDLLAVQETLKSLLQHCSSKANMLLKKKTCLQWSNDLPKVL